MDNSKQSLREASLRLSQVGSIVQLEQVAELLDYYDDEVWVVETERVKDLLRCRVEFSEESIRAVEMGYQRSSF